MEVGVISIFGVFIVALGGSPLLLEAEAFKLRAYLSVERGGAVKLQPLFFYVLVHSCFDFILLPILDGISGFTKSFNVTCPHVSSSMILTSSVDGFLFPFAILPIWTSLTPTFLAKSLIVILFFFRYSESFIFFLDD